MDWLSSSFGLGLMFKMKDDYRVNLSNMFTYNWSKGFKGVMGSPMVCTVGGVYFTGKNTKIKFGLEASEHIQAHLHTMHKISGKWRVAVHQHYYTGR